MASGNTSSRRRKTSRRTNKVSKSGATSRPTVSGVTTAKERKELVQLAEGIGALIIGGRQDRMQDGIQALQRQSRSLLLQQHLEVWLPRFEEHYSKMEKVLGKGLELSEENMINDLRSKVKKGGYKTMKGFLNNVVLPLVSYHGLLLFLNNEAGVRLPDNIRDLVAGRMRAINKVLGAACAAVTLESTIGA